MDCNKAKKMIPLYMDGMLDEKELQNIAEHLQFCGDCKAIHHDLFEIGLKLNEAPEIVIPSNFHWKIPENPLLQEVKPASNFDETKKRKSWNFNWKTLSAIAAVLLISVALSSEMIDIGTIQPGQPGDTPAMTRIEKYGLEIPWEDVKTLEEEEVYYIKQLQSRYDTEVQIEDSYKDEAGIWYFTLKVEDTLYKYEGKGGEIWAEK